MRGVGSGPRQTRQQSEEQGEADAEGGPDSKRGACTSMYVCWMPRALVPRPYYLNSSRILGDALGKCAAVRSRYVRHLRSYVLCWELGGGSQFWEYLVTGTVTVPPRIQSCCCTLGGVFLFFPFFTATV